MFRFISIAIAASFLFLQNGYTAETNIDRNTEATAEIIKKDVPVVATKKNVEKKVIKKDDKVKAIKKAAKPMKKETKKR
jgi:inosine-uridine nucleoside N-ribohydrolase